MGRPKNEDVALRLAIKEKAENVSGYLNKLEEIFSNYSVQEQNGEKITEVSMTVGKIMITFSDMCSMLGVYDE